MKENALYPVVERWVAKHFACFHTAVNKGLKFSRVDVIGVRDVGGDLSGEVETISVEVKRGTEPFATATGQAAGYKVYANRVYLADLRDAPFTHDEMDIASHLGVGLIQVRERSCAEVLSSPYYQPITRLNKLLLHTIGLVSCQLCGCYFQTSDGLRKSDIRKAYEEEKGLIFWNITVGRRKQTRKNSPYESYERRFLCSDCVGAIYAGTHDTSHL